MNEISFPTICIRFYNTFVIDFCWGKNVSLLIGISGCNNECLLTIFRISFMFSSEYESRSRPSGIHDTSIKLNCVLASFALRVVYWLNLCLLSLSLQSIARSTCHKQSWIFALCDHASFIAAIWPASLSTRMNVGKIPSALRTKKNAVWELLLLS